MTPVDWTALGLGVAAGSLMSALFFVGLAFGIQRALQVEDTFKTLAISAALRIALLLGVGWLMVAREGPWAFAGYGIAFLICRRIVTAMVRVPAPAGGAR